MIFSPRHFFLLVLSVSTSESSIHSLEQTSNLLRAWEEVSCPALWGEGGDLGVQVVKSFKQFSKRQCHFAEVFLLPTNSCGFLKSYREKLALLPQSWVSTSFKLLNQVSLICFPNLCWHLLSAVISFHSLCSCGFVPF